MELAVTWPIVVVAFVSLGGGIALYLWAVRKPRARYVNSMNVIAWLLIGLFPTLVIFSFFPGSDAKGSVVGISLSGAIAAFAAIFVFGSRAGAKALARDQKFEELVADNERLRAAAVQPAGGPARKRLIGEQHDLRYRVAGKHRRELVILTGELVAVRGIDVWVSSENTNMQMARYFDRSVSGVVRYLGARRDVGGNPTDDLVADELESCMRAIGSNIVQPGTVIATSSGELQATHDVKRLLHVAAVQGQVGIGYAPVGNMAECVANALAKLDADGKGSYSSILFPLLGTGTAGGDPEIVRQLIASATQYLQQHPDSSVQKVYFLVRHHEDLHLCVHAAGSVEALTRLGGSAEALLELEPATTSA